VKYQNIGLNYGKISQFPEKQLRKIIPNMEKKMNRKLYAFLSVVFLLAIALVDAPELRVKSHCYRRDLAAI